MLNTNIIILLLIICVFCIAILIGLALGGFFARDNKKKEVIPTCNYEGCNKVMKQWILDQRGDIHNSNLEFKECVRCPSRSYSQISNEVRKFGEWKSHDTIEKAAQAIFT
jgi:uncharacterized protein YneF (UPF0154 family)